ncbi:hypothetical protein JCGZ_03539 [Jatropha curcas]|uniref:Aminotransferase-like plant mobile domain-containing protein n=1 Tax=Jatropha curcas TaxID=180498 RepID=A0A067LC27_JATCU|nr:hypothetical protein JCGZ_03539 [Jatropha curcas]
MAFRNQVSAFVQSIPDDLWQIPPMNQLAWLKYFKDLKPNHGFLSWLVAHFNPNTMVFRFEDSKATPTYEEMCAVMDHHPEQAETPALPQALDRSMVYFPDRISRQYGVIQRVPRTHNFESGLITPYLLTNLADCWQNQNTMYLDERTKQDPVTPAYVNWFFTP